MGSKTVRYSTRAFKDRVYKRWYVFYVPLQGLQARHAESFGSHPKHTLTIEGKTWKEVKEKINRHIELCRW